MQLTEPSSLWWLLSVIPLALVFRISLVDRPQRIRFLSLLFRILAVFFLVFATTRPVLERPINRLHTTFLVDLSASIDLEGVESSLTDIESAIEKLHPEDTWSLAGFANNVRTFESTEQLRELVNEWHEGVNDDDFRAGSDVAAALHAARWAQPADAASRIVLISDRETHFIFRGNHTGLERPKRGWYRCLAPNTAFVTS